MRLLAHDPSASSRAQSGRLVSSEEAARGDGASPGCARPEPLIVLFSSDPSLVGLVSQAGTQPWKVQRCKDVHQCREFLTRPNVKLVVLDDQGIEDKMRGWLLDRVRMYAPHASLLYVASDHSPEAERRARSYAASYYTSKPIDSQLLLRVLASFVTRAK